MPYGTSGAGSTLTGKRIVFSNRVADCDYSTGSLIRVSETTEIPGGPVSFSETTSGWREPRGEKLLTHIQWIPRGPLRKEPKEPVWQKPTQLPRLKPRRSGQSNASWNKAVSKFRDLYARTVRWNSRLLAKYARRYQRYSRSLELYRKQQYLLENGLLRWRRPVRTCGPLDDHFYSRTITEDFGVWSSAVTVEADRWAEWKWFGGYVLSQYPIPYSFTQNNVQQTIGFTTDFGTSPLLYADSLANADHFIDEEHMSRKALSRALEKVKAQDYSLGEMTAERHQSFSMMRDILIKIGNLLSPNHVKLRPRRKLSDKGLSRHVADEASNNFLMWQFGLKPLMQDLYQIVQDLSSEARNTGLITVHASATRRAVRSYGSVQCLTKTSVRYVLRYKVENAALAFLKSIGLANPTEILWEVTKWSFVIDWFIAIGQYIDHLTAWTGLDFAGGTKATHLNYQLVAIENTTIDPVDSNGLYYTHQERRFIKTKDAKTRLVLTDPPWPAFPEFKNPFSFYHVGEAIALIIQRLK